MDNFDDFFGEELTSVKNAQVEQVVTNPVLFDEPGATCTLLLADYLTDKQLKYLIKFVHKTDIKVRIVYCFPFVAKEKHMVKGIGRFFIENVRSDLKEFLLPDHPVITVGRAIYATTFRSDMQVDSFYDSKFNNTYFYSPFINNRVYPIDNFFKICAFGQPDKKTGEPIYFYDRFETMFAIDQLRRASACLDCSLPSIPEIECIHVENPNEWLEEQSKFGGWVAVDSETGGLKKLSDKIGNISISFDGKKAYYLEWSKLNPRIFSKFLNSRKLIFANGKFDLLFFAYHGCDLHKLDWDTMVAGHYLNEMRSNSLKVHAFWYTPYGGYDLDLEKYKWQYKGLDDYTKIPLNIRMPYACKDAAVTYLVFEKQIKAMKREHALLISYTETAIPMINVFVKAEYKGFCINWASIAETGDFLQQKIAESREAVRKAYNEPELDVNSKQAVATMLEAHGYPCIAKGKLGFYKTSKAELHEWKKMGYDAVDTLVEYSKWVAIWQTFIGEDAIEEVLAEDESVDSFFDESTTAATKFSSSERGLWKYKAPDGNIHTTFHPFMAASHRHRSSEPNLQNIPKKNYETTKLVRTAYTTPDTIPCKPQEADKIILLCKDRGYVSLYSGETIEIDGKVYLGSEIANLDLDPGGIRAEFEKFYDKDFPDGTESYLQVQDDQKGSLILPLFTDSSKKVFSEIWIKRENKELRIFTKDLKEGDEILFTKSLKQAG